MKSHSRAWVLFALLVLIWQTLPGGPFKYFADMVREGAGRSAEWLIASQAWQAVFVYLVITIILILLLVVGRHKNQLYIAGICSLATLVHHLLLCIRTGQIYPVSLAIAIGLALALFFLIIRAKSPALWLSDAYVVSLSVWMFREGVLAPVTRLLSMNQSPAIEWLGLPEQSLVRNLSGVWGLPLIVWLLIPLAGSILPLVFLSQGRSRG